MRTIPCTPISVKRRASFDQSSAGAAFSPLVTRSTSPTRLAIAGAAAPKVAEQIAAAGDAFFGLYVDQQQRHFPHHVRAGAEHEIERNSTGVAPTARIVSGGMLVVSTYISVRGVTISLFWPRFILVLEALTSPAHISCDRTAVSGPTIGVPEKRFRQSRFKRGL